MVYDGDGNKVRESINGQIITYLIDTLNPTGYAQVLEELQNGRVIRTYTYGNDLLVQDQRDTGGTWSATWYGYDGHGSVRLRTNGAGQITDRYDYDAFGVLLAASGSTMNRYRYCGEQFDDALGLYHLRARYMNAANGRFWSLDACRGQQTEPRTLHKDNYCGSDPENASDPSGYVTLTEKMAAVAVSSAFSAWATIAANYARGTESSIIKGALFGSSIPAGAVFVSPFIGVAGAGYGLFQRGPCARPWRIETDDFAREGEANQAALGRGDDA